MNTAYITPKLDFVPTPDTSLVFVVSTRCCNLCCVGAVLLIKKTKQVGNNLPCLTHDILRYTCDFITGVNKHLDLAIVYHAFCHWARHGPIQLWAVVVVFQEVFGTIPNHKK